MRERVPDLGDERIHGPLVAGVYPVARRELSRYLPRCHGRGSVPQHIEDGPAALAARNGAECPAEKHRPDLARLRGRVEDADRAVKAVDIGTEL